MRGGLRKLFSRNKNLCILSDVLGPVSESRLGNQTERVVNSTFTSFVCVEHRRLADRDNFDNNLVLGECKI